MNEESQSPPVALLTGMTGQDGSYLTELLLEKGYTVHGLVAPGRIDNQRNIAHLLQESHPESHRVILHHGDLTDGTNLRAVLESIQPREIYNLAAQSHVRISYDMPVYTADVVGLGTLRLLEAARQYENATGAKVRFYQASSSEVYGKAAETPQNENTSFHPRSPYACAKAYAFWQTVNYREAYGMFACNGILFNHESPRRGESFVTRKITRGATRIKLGLQDGLQLGNLDARRDWGYAADYVKAMWLMLQHDEPDDYVIATGETHAVSEFLSDVFDHLDLKWQDYVQIDPAFYRPAEVDVLQGDASKARSILNWEPKVRFRELARLMTDADLVLAKREKALADAGYSATR